MTLCDSLFSAVLARALHTCGTAAQGGSQADRLHGIATGCTGFEGEIEGAMIDLKTIVTVISPTYSSYGRFSHIEMEFSGV